MTKKKPPRKKAPATTKPVLHASGFTNVHVVRGLQYAEQVVAGTINACKWVRFAAKRQLDDLAREKADPAYPFRFDENAAGRAAEFLEQLPHTQGPLAFEREDGTWNTLVLEAWQCFIVTTVYGWIRKNSPAHRPVRRFARVYEEIPRSNGKSFALSGALLYSFAENEQGVEAYSAAVDREQAAKVYGEAAAMLVKRPDLAEALGLETSAHAIFQTATHSRAIALSREAKKSGDGKNTYFAAVDELHAHPTREVWDVIDTSTGKRGGNALIWIITTAGFNTSGICYEKRSYATKILEGSVLDDTWFVIIFTLDEEEAEDGWADEVCRAACSDHSHPSCLWRKANPNWGVSVDPIDFQSKMLRAIAIASERNGVLTKHLNIWCNADVAWMDMPAWDRCADPLLREENFAKRACFLGLDLASKVDLVAKAKLFYRDIETEVLEPVPEAASPAGDLGSLTMSPGAADDRSLEKKTRLLRHFYLFVQCYLPEAAVTMSNNSQYDGWVREGWIKTTPGDVTDFETIRNDILNDSRKHDLREVAYDPWQALQLSNELQAKAVVMVEVRPTVENFSEAMKDWEGLVLSGRFHHNANPAMRWMISNVVCHRDARDNIYPRKERPENKIDGPVATIMALNRSISAPVDLGHAYQSGGFKQL